MNIKILSAIVFFMLLGGCVNSQVSETSTDSESVEPELVKLLPAEIDGYRYIGFHDYGERLGFSLRYVKVGESNNYADIYIWDTPIEAVGYSHEEIVYGVTDASIQDIVTIKKKGDYGDIEFLEKLAYGSDDSILTLHKMSMLRGNLSVLSFLYVSEYNGNLLKARITIADNEFNRSRKDIHKFVVDVFSAISVVLDNA